MSLIRLKVWSNDDRKKTATSMVDNSATADFKALLRHLSADIGWDQGQGGRLFLRAGTEVKQASYLRDDDEVILASGTDDLKEDKLAPGPTNYETFVTLLKQGGVANPQQKVLKVAKKYLASRMLLASTPAEAKDIYEEAKLVPETTTKELLKNDEGIDLNGPLPTNSGRALLLFAFSDGVPMVLKLPEDPESAAHEAKIGEALYKKASSKHLVPMMKRTFKRTDGKTQVGLLMPCYVCTLENMPVPIPNEVAFKCAKALQKATKYMHKKIKSAHCDIKPSNVFMSEDGDFHLGDFGSATPLEKPVREKSDLFFPSDLPAVASVTADKYLIAATILDKLGLKDDNQPTTKTIADAIITIRDHSLVIYLQEILGLIDTSVTARAFRGLSL